MSIELIQIIQDVLNLLEEFKYESDEDSGSYSFFEARINEDWFFLVKHRLEKTLAMLKGDDK